MAELAPVSLAQFNARLEKQKQAVSEENNKVNSGKVGWYCVACSKNFSTEKAYVNHLKSKKHLEAQEAFDRRGDINKEELANNRKNRRMEREEAEKQRQQEQLQEELEEDEDIEEVDSDEWEGDEGKSHKFQSVKQRLACCSFPENLHIF